MELLLNLAWLLLALPACWLWRHRDVSPVSRRIKPLQCLFALFCSLVILFPVVSATDDLHVMRAEMEESALNKRSVSHRTNDKPSQSRMQSQPALAASPVCFLSDNVCGYSLPFSPTFRSEPFGVAALGRAPPTFFQAQLIYG